MWLASYDDDDDYDDGGHRRSCSLPVYSHIHSPTWSLGKNERWRDVFSLACILFSKG